MRSFQVLYTRKA